MKQITFLYFDSCPHWRAANANLALALSESEKEVAIRYQTVETPEQAEALGFRGSPTLLVNGSDPFAGDDDAFGLTCRVYSTPDGPAGSPTVAQLKESLAS